MTAKSALIIALIIHAALLVLPGFTMDSADDDPARPLSVGLVIGGGGASRAGGGKDAAGPKPVAEPAAQVLRAQKLAEPEHPPKSPKAQALPEPQPVARIEPKPESKPVSVMQPEPEPSPAPQPEEAGAPEQLQAQKAKAEPTAVAASQDRKTKAKDNETAAQPKPKQKKVEPRNQEPQTPEQKKPLPTRETAKAEPANSSGQAAETDLIALAGPGQGPGMGPDSLPRFGPGDLNGPVVTGCPELSYPARARRMGVEGEVMVEARIGPEGHVEDVTVVDGPDMGLERAAREFVKGCRFKPALRGGEPITSIAEIPIRFNLR